MVSTLVSLLGSGSFLQRKSRNEHEENGEEERPEYRSVKSSVCSTVDISVCCWRYCDHVDRCMCQSTTTISDEADLQN